MRKQIILLSLATAIFATTYAQDAPTAENAQPELIEESEVSAKIVADPTEATHYLRLYGKAGYAAMFDNIDVLNKKSESPAILSNQGVLGGPGLGIGFGYDLEYRFFRFNTGIELNWLRSTSKYAFDATRDMMITQNGVGIPMTYTYRFGYLKETRNLMHVGIPVLVGAQFNRYFFMVGARAGYNLMGNATTKGNYDVTAWDNQLLSQIGNNQQLGLTVYELEKGAKQKLQLKQPEVSVLAEFGVDLDEWLQYVPKKKKKGRNAKPTFRECLHYKASVFAEYELLNQNNMKPDANALTFDGVPVSNANTMLSMPKIDGSVSALTNLFVGVKFAVQYQLPKKKPVVPPVKKPRVVKQRTEQQRATVSTNLSGMVYNSETNQPIKADIILTNSEGEEVYAGPSDSLDGTFTTKLPAGQYHATINKQGYLPLDEDVEFTVEALTFLLQPVKKGSTITLRNLYFDTNKTTIQSRSEKSMNDLYHFLAENPEFRIKIIGHTDSVGSDEDNQILSEGRAQSVLNEMVNRGIDASRLESEGRGESEPIDTNETEEGRQNNRRVVVEIL